MSEIEHQRENRTKIQILSDFPKFGAAYDRAFHFRIGPSHGLLLTLAVDPPLGGAPVVMEVVLGIDNLIFISILSNKLPEAQRAHARLGIALALVMRLAARQRRGIASLTEPVFTLLDHAFSWRDLIPVGRLFLVWKATTEIHHHVSRDGEGAGGSAGAVGLTMWAAIRRS